MTKSVHERLIDELRLYFEAHLAWETKKTHTAGQAARAHLSEIRKLCFERRNEIQAIRRTKPKIYGPGAKDMDRIRAFANKNKDLDQD